MAMKTRQDSVGFCVRSEIITEDKKDFAAMILSPISRAGKIIIHLIRLCASRQDDFRKKLSKLKF